MVGRLFEHAVVIREVHCRGCGYDLRGLEARGQCPECGLDVHDTLVHILDPASSRLPKLRDPERVGDGLVWLMVCMLLGLGAWILGPVAAALDGFVRSNLSPFVPAWMWTVGGVVLLLGLWAVWAFWAPRGEETSREVRGSVRQIAAGLSLCGLVSVTHSVWRGALFDSNVETMIVSLALSVGGIVTYSGLRSVLQTIGRRSRTFRTSIGGRQRVREMNAAIYGFAAASVGRGVIVAVMGEKLSTSDAGRHRVGVAGSDPVAVRPDACDRSGVPADERGMDPTCVADAASGAGGGVG